MNRSTLLLLGLLVILGAIVYFVLPRDEEQIVSYDKKPVTFSVDSAAVVKLSIERPGRNLVIENVGGTWMITSHGNLAADPARVTEVIGGFSRFKSGSLVSSNPAKQQVFQVDSSGSLVTLTERGGAARSIIIGKMGPSFSEVYFRMPGGSNVYLGSGITTWSLERNVKEWRNRAIFATPAEAVTGLVITSGGRSREFVKDSSGWKSGREAVPTETINPLLAALADVRAEDFIDSAVELNGTPSTVAVSGGVAGTLEFYRLANDTGRYAVSTSTSAQRYIVGRYTALQLFKPVGDPRASGVASVRKGAHAAGEPQPGAETVSKEHAGNAPAVPARQPAKKEPEPAKGEAPKEVPKETSKESTQPPASQPPAGGTVNPFKQKPAGAKSAEPPPKAQPQVSPPPSGQGAKSTPPSQVPPSSTGQAPVKGAEQAAPKPPATAPAKSTGGAGDDEGELTVHVVKKGESMTTIAKQYGVSVEQILKWNLLKSISVKPGQELYIFVRK